MKTKYLWSIALCFICASITARSAYVDRYISANGNNSNPGTQGSPLGLSNGLIDAAIEKIRNESTVQQNGVHIHLVGSSFSTMTGIYPSTANFPYFELSGDGINSTTLTYVNDIYRGAGSWPVVGTYQNGTWVDEFNVHDLTIDIDALSHYVYTNVENAYYLKLSGIYARAKVSSIQNVRVKNAGAKGRAYINGILEDAEVFPIFVDVPNEDYAAAYISDCEVDTAHTYDHGYSTGIMVSGDGFIVNGVWQTQMNTTVVVSFNDVHDLSNGNGLGCGGIREVVFAYNNVEDTQAGFNSDPFFFPSADVAIVSNDFHMVEQGISLGTPGDAPSNYYTGWYLQDNDFILKQPTGSLSYVVRMQGGHGAVDISGNTVSYDSGFLASECSTYGLYIPNTDWYTPNELDSQYTVNAYIRQP
jgi:hypothetical protein